MCISIVCICIYIIYNKKTRFLKLCFAKIKLELILKIQVVQRICNPEYVVILQVLPPNLHQMSEDKAREK